jgi:opacity protein-like surface antigen
MQRARNGLFFPPGYIAAAPRSIHRLSDRAMSNRFRRTLQFLLAALFLLPASASAQLGIGGGIAAMGSSIRGAAEDLNELRQRDSITYADVDGGIGFYGTFRIKYSYGGFWRFAGDVAYTYYPNENIRLVEYEAGDTNSATFEVGASLITGSIGLDLALPTEGVRPYASGQFTYTIFNRTLARVSGSESIEDAEVQNKWEGSNEWGLAIGAGVEFAAGSTLALDIGLRYNLANLFSMKETEPATNYLQAGVTLFFGDLLKDAKEEQEDEDERLRGN